MGASVAAKDEKAGKDAPRKRVFVITPIGSAGSPEREHADFVLYGAIKPVFEPAGYEVIRADTMADPSMITDGIFNNIFDCEICVADLSFGNVNVYYELGVRHAQSLPVIHIAETGTKLPFDTAPHNTIFFTRTNWASFQDLLANMRVQLATIEKPGFKVSNPITHARGRFEVAKTADDTDQMVLDLLSRTESLERQLRGNAGRGVMSNINRIVHSGEPNAFLASDLRLQGAGRPLIRRDQEHLRQLGIEIAAFMDQHAGLPQVDVEHNFYRMFGDRIYDVNDKDRDALGRYIQTIEGVKINYTLLTDLMNGVTKPAQL